jgi:hypothetical protein
MKTLRPAHPDDVTTLQYAGGRIAHGRSCEADPNTRMLREQAPLGGCPGRPSPREVGRGRSMASREWNGGIGMENIIIIVVIVLIVLFVLGYFGRGRMRG